MLKARWCRYTLDFTFEAITSRQRMRHKDTYFMCLFDDENPAEYGLGECALFKGLSAEDDETFEPTLDDVCCAISEGRELPDIGSYSSIRFGLESAQLDLANGGKRILFPSPWTRGESAIPINGLVWMGDLNLMQQRIEEKLAQGFRCIKIKVGGIDFESEVSLISALRCRYSPETLTIRLDANGAFTPENALARLERLSQFNIHSIEQPIRAGQWETMAHLCRETPIPIALDEELIGISDLATKREMLARISPQYIILKPSLCGGLSGSDEWIDMAGSMNIGWWITSALESNIGLNAIAQYCASKEIHHPQGLGTGLLYSNNIPSPLTMIGPKLAYNSDLKWQIPNLGWS